VKFPALFRIFCVLVIPVTGRIAFVQAQNAETNNLSKLAPATAATTNLFTTNGVTTTNLFAATNGITRGLGLLEAIRMAVSNNFDVRIERFEPLLSETDIEAAKGAFDPVITASGQHSDTKIDGAHTRAETVNVGLNGRLPTGATYNVGVDARENASRTTAGNVFSQTGSGNATIINARQPLLRNMWIDSFRYQIEISRK